MEAPPQTPAAPLAAAKELEDIYKKILASKATSDVNMLTNQLVKAILDVAIKEGTSDIHLEPRGDMIQTRFRVDGSLRDVFVFSRKDFSATAQIRVMAGFPPQAATAYSPEDGGFQFPSNGQNIRVRVSAFPTIHGDKLVLRVLDMGKETLQLESLGFAPDDLANLNRLIQSPSGIFFVCGITGGGKTTTLCSILRTLTKPEVNIMTLEDPVEYELPRVTQSKINPKAGFNFADGLRSILRQDPNVIMVGEVRDLETAEISMRAALTGHLIFTTIHTISTAGVITRLIDMGIEPFLISSSMLGALAQRLVRRLCACAQPGAADPAQIADMLKTVNPDEANLIRGILGKPGAKFMKPKGCPTCNNTGYKGRLGIFELMTVSKEMRAQVDAKATLAQIRRTAVEGGMKTLLMDGAAKVAAGLTTLDEVAKAAKEI
jgi:type IV pilus assembly protein PilB